ncbi:MAG: gliding motility-associated ABC transporter permease subunit GldF [Chitinophagales bacterium]|nr:gliding motility-associated ABC transporter permease subunit GldF [Chitinophagales bacterium]
MYSIFLKEIRQFFSSLVGYISIGLFLVLSTLFTFVFPATSILDTGFASLDSFFSNAPLFFLFLIPAISMGMFAEEYKTGTIELLLTRPLSLNQIILGKFLAAFALVVFAVLPTLVYYYTIYNLAIPIGNVDTGGIIGSYFGLLLLAASFVALASFASSISNNQIVAFLIGVLFCFLFYMGLDFIAQLPIFVGRSDYFVEHLGINAHYLSMSRGVIDTRDLIYFLSLIGIFLLLTKLVMSKKK